MTLYFRDRTLRLIKPGEPVTDIPLRVSGRKEVRELVDRFLHDEAYRHITVKSTNTTRLRSEMLSCFTLVKAAGGFVRDQSDRRLFIFRNGCWDLPKGKMESKNGNTPGEEAIREVGEETGVWDLIIQKSLPATYHVYPGKKAEWFLKITRWFEMQAPGKASLTPQTEEGITRVQWFRADETAQVLANTFPSLIPMINQWIEHNRKTV